MLLDELFEHPSATTLVRLEQTINDGSPSGFTALYQPSPGTAPGETSVTEYQLPVLAIYPATDIAEYGSKRGFHLGDLDFYLHPDMLPLQGIGVVTKETRVLPTASGRTVIMADNPGWHIKLAYKNLIGRIPRHIGRPEASSAVEVSSILEEAAGMGRLDPAFHLLREPFARVVPGEVDGLPYEWGFVLRDPKPYPAPRPGDVLLPAFSLFASDRLAPADPTLLRQLITTSGLTPSDYLTTQLLLPLVHSYFSVLLTCGLQLEAHAQNVLFLVSKDGTCGGMVIRDADSVDKDLDLISELSLDVTVTESAYKCRRRTQDHYHIMHSVMFDFKLGQYLLEPLIVTVVREFGIDPRPIYEEIQAVVSRYQEKLPSDFFPDGEWFNYANIVHRSARSRNYISNRDLRFRAR